METLTISWIFLSVGLASQKLPATYREISMIADGINHAVPNHKEMQESITWLVNKEMILKTKNLYSLSESGEKLLNKARSNSENLIQMWKTIEKDIQEMLNDAV